LFSQTYQGPAQGSVSAGAVVNTSSFSDFPITGDTDPIIRGEMNVEGNFEPLFIESDKKEVLQSTYTEDINVGDSPNTIGDNAMLLRKFIVSLDNNVIPPDPTIAVGPNHVMVLTNNGVGIRIYDKQGTLLKSISSSQWWSAVWPTQDGDPQIFYDHFSGRWVMVFMQVDDVALTAGNLLAYSDDDDPLGTWYMYRLDTKLHGTTASNTWGDYPQIGFDEQAIYIMTRCFPFAGGNPHTKIRIISKAELYASNAGPLTYKDIWDIFDSSLPVIEQYPDIIHPSFQYSPAGEHYFLYAYRSGGNRYSFYKLTNPITSPVLTRVNINVPFFGPTPDANQLGGGTPRIAANGSHIKTSPVFRDGFLYATHSMRNSVYPNYASIKYVKINVATNTVVESAELGANGYFYIYPAIAVDKDGNVGITCSRSGDNEYMGSYFTTRRASDPVGLSSSGVLQPGLGNYILTFGGERNRWGDYLGAFLDPADEYSFWMFSQFASGTNAYATVVGQVRLQPFPGAHGFSYTDFFDFGSIEVGSESSELSFTLKNFGEQNLVINNIPDSLYGIRLTSTHSFPITIVPFDSVEFSFKFQPNTASVIDTVYTFENNSTNFTGIRVKATGFQINPVEENQIYSISGSQNSGNFSSINIQTGVGVNIGETGFSNLIGLAIHPKTRITYGLISSAQGSQILRINGTEGDSYPLFDLALANLYSMSFDSSGQLYTNTQSGIIYSIDLSNGTFLQVSQMPVQRVAIAFNQVDNQLWGSVKNLVGVKDRIIKIELLTGDTTNVGQTGFTVNTNSIIFNGAGNLYGITGTASTANNFISINTNTGVGTIIGSTGLLDLKAIAYSPSSLVGIDNEELSIPNNFALEQNYPNPFNPSTQIKFALPVNADVKITIYNLLGEVVKQLTAIDMNAGSHSVQWNADDDIGNKVSSGIYFYKLKANGVNGSEFSQVRKMILLK
jgi:hypothetical protein